MKEVVIIGAGGHSSVIIDIIECMIEEGVNIKIKGLLDDNESINEFKGYKVLDKIENAREYNNDNTEYIIAIGNNKIRKNIYESMKELKYFKAIHPSSIIAKDVKIQEGTAIMARAIINSGTIIGKHSIINSGAIVEHDNKIDDFVHISPGATLCGGVRVLDKTHIGANATVIQGISIGSESIVGAGSTVIKDIESKVIAVGSPAIAIKNI